jgi:hypothetical protein
MIALMTKTDSGWEPDKFLAQPEHGLVRQRLVTTYQDLDGNLWEKTITRKFFNSEDYVDTTSNERIG